MLCSAVQCCEGLPICAHPLPSRPCPCQASTAALQELPAVNAVIDDATNEIVYRGYVDVSVAVASATGLVVPVLRNTERMSFAVRPCCDPIAVTRL